MTVLDAVLILLAGTAAGTINAAVAWRAYGLAGGPRTRVVADFLVGPTQPSTPTAC